MKINLNKILWIIIPNQNKVMFNFNLIIQAKLKKNKKNQQRKLL